MCMCQSIFRIVAKVSTLLRVAWLAMLDLTKLWHRPIPVTTYIFCYIMIFILVHIKDGESIECHVLSFVWKKNEKIPDFKGLTYYSAFYFAGWIFGLSSENVESRSRLQRDSIASSTRSSSTISTENNNAIQIKMEKLRRELEVLQTKVLEERERWLSNSLIVIR